jgi:hypothetical protein
MMVSKFERAPFRLCGWPSSGSDVDTRPNLLWSFHLGSTFQVPYRSTLLTESPNTLSDSALLKVEGT